MKGRQDSQEDERCRNVLAVRVIVASEFIQPIFLPSIFLPQNPHSTAREIEAGRLRARK
jgi:hypothetical protein